MFYIAPLVTSLLFIFIGIFAFVKQRSSNVNRCFLFLCLTTFVWQFSWTILFSPLFSKYDDIIIRIGYSGIIFIPIVYFNFLATFLGRQKNENFLIKISYFIGLMFLFLLWSGNSFIEGKYGHHWGFYPRAGMAHPIFLMLLGVLTLRGVTILITSLKKSGTPHRYNQIKYVLFSLLFYFPSASDFLVNYGYKFYPVGFVFILISFAIIAFAIIKHQLLDIEVIIKKTLIFAGLFIASYTVFVSFAYLGSILFENVIQNRWIALIPSVFVIVLILRPLENFLRITTDKYLFQKRYDYRHLLKTFADEVLTVLDLEMLVNLTVNKLVEIMKLENASILLSGEESEGSRIVASAGDVTLEHQLSASEDLASFMQKRGGYVLRPDSGGKKSFSTEIVQDISKLKASLIIPLTHQNNMVGVLSLGKKKSDEEFTQDDIDILLPLAKTLSIAITNAQLFEQLSEAQAQAAQREKMAVIGTLSAGINHEICNPLGIARGQCEMFLLNLAEGIYKDKSQDELLEKAKEIMEKVINETDRATVITRKLSSFAKPAKGKVEDDIQVEKELEEVISLIEHDLKLDNIQVVKEFEKDLPPIEADKKQVQEIFFNIIRNAAQSIKGSGKITIRASNKNEKVTVGIEDTGEGITKNNLDKIFNPFYTTKEPGKGTGLGLFIVKQIIERNKGKIFVKSQPGEGTIFTVEFNALGSAQVG